MQEQNWKELFYFSKSQRRGILVLVFLILLIALLPTILDYFQHKPTEEVDYETQIKQLKESESVPLVTNELQKEQTQESLEKEGAERPALKKEQQQPSGLSKENQSGNRPSVTDETVDTANDPDIVLDVNNTTAAELAKLSGIGPVLSARIIKFRDALGGFASIDQVAETYGIEPHVFERIQSQLEISDVVEIKKHNFNTENAEQLASHPYISNGLAKQIVNYREKVQPFESDEDVKSLYFVDEELFVKLKPYITY